MRRATTGASSDDDVVGCVGLMRASIPGVSVRLGGATLRAAIMFSQTRENLNDLLTRGERGFG